MSSERVIAAKQLLATLPIDLAGPRDACTPTCEPFVEKWEGWFDRTFVDTPAAVVGIIDADSYAALIGDKSRNMLRKADRLGYQIGRFDRNDHVDEIYAINRSKMIRSGGPMRGGYLERPALISRPPALCERHQLVSVGMFRKHRWDGDDYVRGELRAYCHLVIANQLAIINTILGHAEDLPNGIMNALVAGTVEQLHARNGEKGRHGEIRFLNYTTLDGPEGLNRFKRSVGFTPMHLRRKP